MLTGPVNSWWTDVNLAIHLGRSLQLIVSSQIRGHHIFASLRLFQDGIYIIV